MIPSPRWTSFTQFSSPRSRADAARLLDNDVIEILDDFALKAKERHIEVKLLASEFTVDNPTSYTELLGSRSRRAQAARDAKEREAPEPEPERG